MKKYYLNIKTGDIITESSVLTMICNYFNDCVSKYSFLENPVDEACSANEADPFCFDLVEVEKSCAKRILKDRGLNEHMNKIKETKPNNKKIPFSTCKNLMDSISALAPYAGITNVSEIEEYTRSVFLDIMEVWEKENNAKWEIALD